MRPYDPERLLISLHIPKTAGTSFRSALATWFGPDLHLHYPGWGKPFPPVEKEAGACVHGHFTSRNGTGVGQVFPHYSQVITIMRDPFDRLVSEWRFHNYSKSLGTEIPELADNPSFDTWFCRRRDEVLIDPITRMIKQMPEPFAPEDMETYFDRRFVGVGITEDLPNTMALFARLLNKPQVPEERVNITPAEYGGDFSAYRSEHEKVFAIEHELYGVAKHVYQRQLGSLA